MQGTKSILLEPVESERLTNAKIIWLSTVSKDLIPHLVPIWFVLNDSKLFICTESKSVKVRNMLNNPIVAFSLEDGIRPLAGVGKVIFIRKPDEKKDSTVIKKFKDKYDWNILQDEQYNNLIEIEIEKLLFRQKKSDK